MSRNGGARSSGSSKNGSLVAGVLIGMVLGLAIAGGVAWYITKTPSPYQAKESQREAKPEARPEPEAPRPVVSAAPAKPAPAQAASGAADGKPRFEFYTVLTDPHKQEGLPSVPKSAGHSAPATTQRESAKPAPAPAARSEPYFLQAGSFSNADDADKLKARLALMGLEASVQTVTIADKGIWHRVRLGPYTNTDELNKARLALKQNGVDAAPMRAQ